jgi:serine protease AprX
MAILSRSILKKANLVIALGLSLLLCVSPVLAGISMTVSNGIVITGADGVVINGADGIVISGADSFLNTGTDGIVINGADGLPSLGADGIVISGADGYAYPNSVQAASADGLTVARAEGVVLVGANGIVISGADGSTQTADSVALTMPSGIVINGADGIVINGADGWERIGAEGIVINGADNIVTASGDGIVINGADSASGISLDGAPFSMIPNGLAFTGVTGIVINGADDIELTGADGLVASGPDGIVITGAGSSPIGLQSIDPELAVRLNQLTDDSNVNAVVVYHNLPGESDLADLHTIGILGGTRFRTLPAVIITASRAQIIAISRLPAVRSIFGNRTLNFTSEPEVRAVTGVERARRDAEITAYNRSLPVSGRNVTVAVLDSGIDATHGDLSGRVIRNVKLSDTQSVGVGFSYPINLEGLLNTDQLLGHGTFVAGMIAGNGSLSSGKYAGVAPNARLVGISAGDLTLAYVLNGLDYLLTNGAELGVRVVNCSFSTNTVYDTNDPVNIATKMLTEAGINVVFSAGNTGPGANSLNPYSVAPWVISVGATDTQARLANFSSQGNFASPLFHPTLVAPGVNVVSTRGSGIANVTGVGGLLNADLTRLSQTEILHYTTSNGTSFSAPQVAGTIALMLEANPNLTPAEVRDILQRTATPLPPYYLYEAGAGMLNVHAAVLESAFPSRRIGSWRGTLDRGQVRFINDPLVRFSATVQPGATAQTTLTIPEGALKASIQIAWGPLWSSNDLGLYVYDSSGTLRAQSNYINLPGLGGKRERVVINFPSPGTWRVVVKNTLLTLTSQPFVGVLEVARAQYSVSDLDTMSSALREEVQQNLRTYTMFPIGNRFRSDFAVSRSDLAMSLVIGARVPQYLPGQPTYQDVRDSSTRLFVESVQASPGGTIFPDAAPGGNFRPNDSVSRLMATVALVRAAGLRSEAEAKSDTLLPFPDAATIPVEYRGYVSVAVSRGLIQADPLFRPETILTRAELAHAMAIIETRAIQ